MQKTKFKHLSTLPFKYALNTVRNQKRPKKPPCPFVILTFDRLRLYVLAFWLAEEEARPPLFSNN
jgi:hypothetical protein